MDKRKRNINFSVEEEELLVELVKKYKSVIENKKTDAVMWKEKEECWLKIVEEFNSQGLLVVRSLTQLQLKYKNMKKVVRKKSTLIRFEHLKTGGGNDQSQPLNYREENLKDMIQLSVEGLPSEFDCDMELNNTDNRTDDILLNYEALEDDEPYYVTVMPDENEKLQLPCTSTIVTEQAKQYKPKEQPAQKLDNIDTIDDKGASVSKWNFVTPENLKHRKSTPLRSNKHFKSLTAEAKNLMGRKEHLVECQIRCLEQEFEINELKKKKNEFRN